MTEGKLEVGQHVVYEGRPSWWRRPYPIPVGTRGQITHITDRGYYAIYRVEWDTFVPGKHRLQRYHLNELRVLNGELKQ